MRPIARLGDKHICPYHPPNVIVQGGTALCDNRPIARVGDKCACGGVILDGATDATCDGRPVAVLGSKTSCGGVIASGSPTATAT